VAQWKNRTGVIEASSTMIKSFSRFAKSASQVAFAFVICSSAALAQNLFAPGDQSERPRHHRLRVGSTGAFFAGTQCAGQPFGLGA
jgi:hypothetical protein